MVADMAADMKVHMVADMEVEKVADKMADIKANMADKKNWHGVGHCQWWPTWS